MAFPTTSTATFRLRAVGIALVAALGLALGGCAHKKSEKAAEVASASVTAIGVNSYLWRAALETLSFMPLTQADSAGGVIITDWYSNPEQPERASQALGLDPRPGLARRCAAHRRQPRGAAERHLGQRAGAGRHRAEARGHHPHQGTRPQAFRRRLIRLGASHERAAFRPVAADGRWQRAWDEAQTFRADDASSKPRSYVLEMFPYPSGRIHIGHVRNYTMGDVIARYKRMRGTRCSTRWAGTRSACRPRTRRSSRRFIPASWTYQNIANMKAQLKRLGFALDWSREFATCDPAYYGHEQALFLDLYEAGLVYRKESAVNWDPVDQTVLANEQVIDGKGWRSGALVEKRKLASGSSRSPPSRRSCSTGSTRSTAGPRRSG